MLITATPLEGLFELTTSTHRDSRGEFTRLFCVREFADLRPELRFVQTNHSVTRGAGTVRGLHFQRSPHCEAKLIRCIRGRVFDVAVDMRPLSSTFGAWHAIELSDTNDRQFFIPEGFAHGFQALTDDAELLYQHTAPYAPESESGILFCDAELDIAWPVPVSVVSVRDAALPTLARAFREMAA